MTVAARAPRRDGSRNRTCRFGQGFRNERPAALTLVDAAATTPEAVCVCAAEILTTFGASFAAWRDANISAGTPLGGFPPFTPGQISLCADLAFGAGTAESLHIQLVNRYRTYTEVSYRLRLLTDALSELRNTYPSGTLHDCDEGDDRNPIRLGQTALGSNVQ